MGHAVFGCDSGDGDGMVADIGGVGDNEGVSFGFDGLLAEVVLEGDTYA